jgi:hypothetical protein
MTDATDYTADLIVADLQRRNVRVARLDPGVGPVRMEATLACGRWRDAFGDEHRAVDLAEVSSVLWRWPTPPTGHSGISDPARRSWAAREDTAAVFGVLKTLLVRWVNHPDQVACASSKPGQLVEREGRFYLLPAQWRPDLNATYVLHEDEGLRVEFSPGDRPVVPNP